MIQISKSHQATNKIQRFLTAQGFVGQSLYGLALLLMPLLLILGACNGKSLPANGIDEDINPQPNSFFEEGESKILDPIQYAPRENALSKDLGAPIFSEVKDGKNSFYYVHRLLKGNLDIWKKYQDFTLSSTVDTANLRSRTRLGANLVEFVEAADLFKNEIPDYDSVSFVYNVNKKTFETGTLSFKADSSGLTYIYNNEALYYPVADNTDIVNQVGNFGESEGHRAISNVYGISLYNDQFVKKNGEELIIMASLGWGTPVDALKLIEYQSQTVTDENGQEKTELIALDDFSGSVTRPDTSVISATPVYTSTTGYFQNPTYYVSPLFSLYVSYHKEGTDPKEAFSPSEDYPRVNQVVLYTNLEDKTENPLHGVHYRYIDLKAKTNFIQSNPPQAVTGYPFVLEMIKGSTYVDSMGTNTVRGGYFAGKFYGPKFDALGGVFNLEIEIDKKVHYFWGVLAQTSYGNRPYSPDDYAVTTP